MPTARKHIAEDHFDAGIGAAFVSSELNAFYGGGTSPWSRCAEMTICVLRCA